MLGPLDVILIDDDTIEPPAPKLVACIEARLGLFFRINTKGHWQVSIPLIKIPHNNFLKHDSFLECGLPLELDDYIVDDSMSRSGIIGRVDESLKPNILAIVNADEDIPDEDKRAIALFLR